MPIYRTTPDTPTEPAEAPPAPAGAVGLPDGAWVLLREHLADAPRRLHKAIEVAKRPGMLAWAALPAEVRPSDDTEAGAGGVDLMRAVAALPEHLQAGFFDVQDAVIEATILALILDWSYPAPVCPEALLELPATAYDVLADAAEERSAFPVREDTLAAMADPTQARVASLA